MLPNCLKKRNIWISPNTVMMMFEPPRNFLLIGKNISWSDNNPYNMWYSNIENFKNANGYTIDGIWYPRVTSIVGIKAKPALYMYYAGLPSYKAGEAIKARSAEEGTLVHETIEAILKKEPVAIPPNIKPTVDAFNKFHSQHEIIPLKVEERVVSKRHGYAGTIDVLAEVDGRVGILDIKTSIAIY